MFAPLIRLVKGLIIMGERDRKEGVQIGCEEGEYGVHTYSGLRTYVYVCICKKQINMLGALAIVLSGCCWR